MGEHDADYGLFLVSAWDSDYRLTRAYQRQLEDEMDRRHRLDKMISKLYWSNLGKSVSLSELSKQALKVYKQQEYLRSGNFCCCAVPPEKEKQLDKDLARCVKCGGCLGKFIAG